MPKWLQETDENTWKEKCWRRRKEKQLSQRQASNSEWLDIPAISSYPDDNVYLRSTIKNVNLIKNAPQ